MIVTRREQALISAFLKDGVLDIAQMLEVTKTSRRTLYRDLEKLQNSLPDEIQLRNSEQGYYLTGNLAALSQAHELVEFSATERLYGELLLLIENQASIARLTEQFGISQPTATNDLHTIEQALQANGLSLQRERGLKIVGNEDSLRSVFVASLRAVSQISEILIGNLADNRLLAELDLSQFMQVRRAFSQVALPDMTDKTKNLMVLFMTVSLLRIKQRAFVSADSMRRPSKRALNFVNQVILRLMSTSFTLPEITYLASVYDTLYFGSGQNILFNEKFDSDFSYKIRQLIDKVSTDLQIEFSKDDRLYGLLYAHLKESLLLPELFSPKQNEFVQKIATDNAKIYQVVKQRLSSVLQKQLSEVEVAFVTLHFAATLERSDLVLPLRAALVTTYGRISCELLISSLRKNFPFLKKIDLIQPSSSFDKKTYDVILTTEKNLDYLYVNRTLDQKNLDDLRHQLRNIQQNAQPRTLDFSEKEFVNLSSLFAVGNTILNTFEIVALDNPADLASTVNQIVALVDSPRPQELSQLLQKRFEDTHLAIPETHLALLHGLNDWIERPLFQIFDLKNEVTVQAMNHQSMTVKRLLLLLAPTSLADDAAYLLGKISSSIIENKLYTTIYDAGNQAVVSELLRQIITEAIRKYGE